MKAGIKVGLLQGKMHELNRIRERTKRLGVHAVQTLKRGGFSGALIDSTYSRFANYGTMIYDRCEWEGDGEEDVPLNGLTEGDEAGSGGDSESSSDDD